MVWTELKPDRAERGIKVSCNRYGGSLGMRLVVSISVEIVEELGLGANARVKIYRGHGDHARKIRIAPDKNGPYRLGRAKGGSLRLIVPCGASLPEASRKSKAVPFRTDAEGRSLVVCMPDWFGPFEAQDQAA